MGFRGGVYSAAGQGRTQHGGLVVNTCAQHMQLGQASPRGAVSDSEGV